MLGLFFLLSYRFFSLSFFVLYICVSTQSLPFLIRLVSSLFFCFLQSTHCFFTSLLFILLFSYSLILVLSINSSVGLLLLLLLAFWVMFTSLVLFFNIFDDTNMYIFDESNLTLSTSSAIANRFWCIELLFLRNYTILILFPPWLKSPTPLWKQHFKKF